MNNNFYIPKSTQFNNVVHSIWQVERNASFHREQILPKGIVEIIFNFSDSFHIPAQLDTKRYHLPNCFINGFNTVPILLQLPKQQVFFGVRFQPLAVKKIFGIPGGEFLDTPVDLTLLDSTFNSVWHQLSETNTFNLRVSTFLDWLERKIPDLRPQETLINHFLSAVNQHDLSVSELSRTLCYSTRQLTRKIFEATGMNTEEIMLYKKYLHAVHLIHHTDSSLTEVAYQSRFSDQSHFIKTFKSYTKMTPGEYKRTKSSLKGHILENVR